MKSACLQKIVSVLCGVLLLCGCQEAPITYDYLMTHPKELRRQLDQCEKNRIPRCQMVTRAGMDFSSLISDRGMDPQGFGKKIIAAQYKLSQLEVAYNSDPLSVSAKSDYDSQLQAVNVLLAVIAATSSVSNGSPKNF